MQFVAGGLNGVYLRAIHDKALKKADSVKIAVAYASGDPEILHDCWQQNIKVTFWGRYDETGPISLPILRTFLDRKSPNYICKLVPDIFHSKVIWWEGYGAYIGSANLTNNAWYGNIEAGLFLGEEELAENGMNLQLFNFFQELDDHSYALTDEIYSELTDLRNTNDEIDKKAREARSKFNRKRMIPEKKPLTYLEKRTKERRRKMFLKEWQDTLQILRSIAGRVSDSTYRPTWVRADVPKGVQADQFLHAFYYSQVRDGTRSHHWSFYDKNKKNPEAALVDAMKWWSKLPKPPHNEDITMYEWATFLNQRMKEQIVTQLSLDDFIEVCARIHALREHSLRVKYTTFGSPMPLPKMNSEERIKLLAKWLYEQRSVMGKNVLETIYHILWGGPLAEAPSRIFDASSNDEWKIPHFGISTVGELLGWAMPDQFPPRNGRTSKALTALGYDVTIHSE